ncbi:hypothetical protein E4P82_02315 [Candidatus Competibacter phosphatis]|uniref:Lipoprotein SmpA/OmlA domain-containing protein n=1 Tax=Candidatus Competibacter phosphatis TaxID=221280 RepID=A0ABX1TFI2_9GAMM|nr:hypothetical protein [Candidatus Competibacter phosphatis]NMQ18130.1 hypothetical protein [Candidatus Competibacter phosphatis]
MLNKALPSWGFAATFTVALVGCAVMQKDNTQTTEQTLSAAGFQMKLADTPAKLAQLQGLPQRKLVPQQQNGAIRYVYVDAQYCQCVYAGTETNYQEYQKLALQRQIALEEVSAAQMDTMDWEMWGPWGW